ncbi:MULTISPECIES: hypothetical protein [Bacillus]|uniref:Membrane transport protein MMPL domain-containing protein n=1 Tax=Bacillus glycinifermentans TaxID=1664069 RepID=A0ABU6H817_9BACI|nr:MULTISPECIES: hypothetical protein [Bacillus]MEC0341859.1 hypothetical protein [Bacillus sonorensis]MEC0457455.1 hypothetical protein [Bacillus sonorensis]MEC0487138.1 hypothetical protein [Bacillus glycinifermentans]MEC0530750.1 hypothetical protein [Bacillus sonorensis]UBF35353.1 hypothetical protein K9N56_23710 [Bacillus sp. PM8313]
MTAFVGIISIGAFLLLNPLVVLGLATSSMMLSLFSEMLLFLSGRKKYPFETKTPEKRF